MRPGNTEVGRLAEALDMMLASIEAAYLARADGEARALRSEDRMRRFIADASHELRTPLTSVRGLAEYGLQQGDAASREELLRLMGLIAREAGRMGRLVDDLLLLARFDAGRAAGPPARRPGQPRGRSRPAGPHRGPRAADHAGGRRAGDRRRRRGTAAPGHRQPDRQRHPAHPARNAGHGDRDRARPDAGSSPSPTAGPA